MEELEGGGELTLEDGGELTLDDNGWAAGAVAPLDPDRAWSLLSPDPSSRVDAGRWAHQARTFFGSVVDVVRPKKYPSATLPIADALEIDVLPLRALDDAKSSRVLVVTVPLDRAPAVRAAAVAAARAIGGAGFDVLVVKGQRLWQVSARLRDGSDERAPLVVAAVLASTFLAPLVPPGGGAIFGVKGARERLEKAGYRT